MVKFNILDFFTSSLNFLGLMLELFVQENQYVHAVTEATGLKVVVHSQDRMPFPEDEGFEMSPGWQTNIGVRMVT